jgi:hypothetical protein
MNKNIFGTFFILFGILINGATQAQYYYKDIICNYESQQLIKQYKAAKITKIQAKSILFDGNADANFMVKQKINASYTLSDMESTIDGINKSYSINEYNSLGKVIKTIDSTETTSNISYFTYDTKNRVKTIKTLSTGINDYNSEEIHYWNFDTASNPTQLLIVKNNNDTIQVKFELDENGNVAEELHYRKKDLINSYFFYYNDEGALTDIVRFNENQKKLLPDMVFEYNDKLQLITLKQYDHALIEYNTTKYIYNEAGLKTEEIMYFKDFKAPLGKMVYSYIK